MAVFGTPRGPNAAGVAANRKGGNIMPTTRTWIGGGNNQASNPRDWSPPGTPIPGDVLIMTGGTMDISNDDLAGDGLQISGGATINMANDAALSSAQVTGAAQFNIRGIDQLYVFTFDPSDSITVDLAKNAQWVGGFNTGSVVIDGGAHSFFYNVGFPAPSGPGVSIVSGDATIDTDVTGTVIFLMYSSSSNLTLMKSVGSGQTISFAAASEGVTVGGGHVVVEKPASFQGSVFFQSTAGELDLIGLAKADSYTYQNDMLSIFSGKSIIDTLRFTDDTPYGFVVEKTANSVNIVAIADPTSPPIGLPLHTST